MQNYIDSSNSIVGKKLKASTDWPTGQTGTDIYGFRALPGGFGTSTGTFGWIGLEVYFATSGAGNATDAQVIGIDGNSPNSLGYATTVFGTYVSVRCVLN